MFLRTKRIDEKDNKMIAKDYYEKFEVMNNHVSKWRNNSITNLLNNNSNKLLKRIDVNYSDTLDFLEKIDFFNSRMILLQENKHIIGYAIVRCSCINNHYYFEVDDIIIHDENEYCELANGEIDMVYNIYRVLCDAINEHIEKFGLDNYSILYNYVDSSKLTSLLLTKGYKMNHYLYDAKIDEKADRANASFYQMFTREKDEKKLCRTDK